MDIYNFITHGQHLLMSSDALILLTLASGALLLNNVVHSLSFVNDVRSK